MVCSGLEVPSAPDFYRRGSFTRDRYTVIAWAFFCHTEVANSADDGYLSRFSVAVPAPAILRLLSRVRAAWAALS